jgi:hypothetical protein
MVFISQILLISYYFPRKILGRMRSVMETCPPENYPRLYPRSIEYYKLGQRIFKVINQGIVLLGFVILFLIVMVVDHSSFADDGFISEAWPAAYGMIQFLPLMLLEFTEFSQFKLMRQAHVTSSRKAELRRRRLFDYVSPGIFGLAVLLLLSTMFFDLYVHQFVIQWDHDTVQRIVVMLVTNLFLAALGAWHLYGRKLDPHQAPGDRTKQITAQLTALLYISMALSIFLMTAAADDVFNLDFLDATLMSLYFQVIVFLSVGHVLRSLRIEDIDFDVYRSDTAAP